MKNQANKNQPTATGKAQRQTITNDEQSEEKNGGYTPCGSLVDSDEESENEWEGKVSFAEPGKYNLRAKMRKDTKGNLSVDLRSNLTDEAIEDKDVDRGVLFKNNRKRRSNESDYTGHIVVAEAGEFVVAGNVMTSKSNKDFKYMELLVLRDEENGVSAEEMAF